MQKIIAEEVSGVFSCLEGSAVGVSLTDGEGRFVRVSARYSQLTGYLPAELLGISYTEITHKTDLAKSLQLGQKMHSGEVEKSIYEKRFVRKNGGTLWARNSVLVIRNGESVGTVLAITEDITDQKAIEEELRESKTVLRKLANCIAGIKARDLLSAADSRRVANKLIGALTSRKTANETTAPEIASFQSGFSLPMELAKAVDRFTANTGIPIQIEAATDLQDVPKDTGAVVLRSVRALLAHVHRYSGTNTATVSLSLGRAELIVEVRDSGEPSRPLLVSDLAIERLGANVRAIGGRLELVRAGGSMVRLVRIPRQ